MLYLPAALAHLNYRYWTYRPFLAIDFVLWSYPLSTAIFLSNYLPTRAYYCELSFLPRQQRIPVAILVHLQMESRLAWATSTTMLFPSSAMRDTISLAPVRERVKQTIIGTEHNQLANVSWLSFQHGQTIDSDTDGFWLAYQAPRPGWKTFWNVFEVFVFSSKFPALKACFIHLHCVVNGPFRCLCCRESLHLVIALVSLLLECFAIDCGKSEIKVISFASYKELVKSSEPVKAASKLV